MTAYRNREEVVNTQLAILISRLGVTADAETIHVHGKYRPDVLFELRGLRVVIEGKFSDHPRAKQTVLNDARSRVRDGIAHIATAVIYPPALRTSPTTRILGILEKSQLQYRIVTEAHESDDWYAGNPVSLMDALRRAQEVLVRDDIVETTARSLSGHLDGIARLWMGQAGACDRLSTLLGITPPRREEPEKATKRRQTSAKVSALVLANALIFQEQLAAANRHILPLQRLSAREDLVPYLCTHWAWISDEIDYVPIFRLGEQILNELPSSHNSTLAVRSLISEAQKICREQAALRHDLMGRIYHWLLHHAKYLGTYYTAASSATLLLKLALALPWSRDFGDPTELAKFKVGDLACGTGTLLMASAQAISDAYIKARAASDRTLSSDDLRALHKALMENVLYGYDVLPSAVHLTAATLAILAPEVAFVQMNLFVMPLGMIRGNPRLGSLDFLYSTTIRTQMSLDMPVAEATRSGASASYATLAKVPHLDLCAMNPPFVRSVGGNLLFGSLPDDRGQLQTELKRRVKKIGASATAGLGSVFVALADRWLKTSGRLAFVLPAALASGEAWADTRRLIAGGYHLETVVASHDAERPNFSENTELSELLFIARKLKPEETSGRTTYINLWRNPRSIHEAMDLANRITQVETPVPVEGAGITAISGPNGKLGEIITLPPAIDEQNWTGALFAQTDLLRTCWALENGEFRLPVQRHYVRVPACRLDTLGSIGPDRKRISEGFKVTPDDWTPYPAFWGHESVNVRTMSQQPNAHLAVWRESPRGPEYGPHLWERSGNILLVERLRSNTHRVVAVGFDQNVLGNTWWALQPKTLSQQQQKTLLLWLNSSLSLLLVYGRRVITQGAWMQMKQPAWESMPALDVRHLSATQLRLLASAYDRLSQQDLNPIAKLNADPVRQEIDDTLCRVLELPSLTAIRELLAREPGLTAREIVSRNAPEDADSAEEGSENEQTRMVD